MQNLKPGRCRGRFLMFGIEEVIVFASKIQNSDAAAVEFLIFSFGIKDVLVVRYLDFADWPFPERAAAKLKKPKYDFAVWALL